MANIREQEVETSASLSHVYGYAAGMIPIVLYVRIIEMLASRHRFFAFSSRRFWNSQLTAAKIQGLPLAATSRVGSAGDCVTADVPARPVDDREMRCVAVGSQYGKRLGTDLHRFTPAIHMVIVIGGFDERSGEQSEISLPLAGRICRINRGPSGVGSIQP